MSTNSVINFVDAVAVYNGYPALAGVTFRVQRNEIVLLQGQTARASQRCCVHVLA